MTDLVVGAELTTFEAFARVVGGEIAEEFAFAGDAEEAFGLVFGGDEFGGEFEEAGDLAEADAVGIAEEMSFDELTVDLGAVGGFEVGERVDAGAIDELGVGTGDGRVVDYDFHIGSATDEDRSFPDMVNLGRFTGDSDR